MRMKPLDAVWLMMESDDTPMHVDLWSGQTDAARALHQCVL